MNILCITLEQSLMSAKPDILDFLTNVQTNKGVNHEKYWLLNTDVQVQAPEDNIEIHHINTLFQKCQMHGYSSLMIKKETLCSPTTSQEEPSETTS